MAPAPGRPALEAGEQRGERQRRGRAFAAGALSPVPEAAAPTQTQGRLALPGSAPPPPGLTPQTQLGASFTHKTGSEGAAHKGCQAGKSGAGQITEAKNTSKADSVQDQMGRCQKRGWVLCGIKHARHTVVDSNGGVVAAWLLWASTCCQSRFGCVCVCGLPLRAALGSGRVTAVERAWQRGVCACTLRLGKGSVDGCGRGCGWPGMRHRRKGAAASLKGEQGVRSLPCRLIAVFRVCV